MNVAMLAEMAADGGGDRVAVGPADSGLTYRRLWADSGRAANLLRDRGAAQVAFVGVNSAAFPVALFGAAVANLPFAPLNYRWSDDQLRRALDRLAPAVVIADQDVVGRLEGTRGLDVIERDRFLADVAGAPAGDAPAGAATTRPAVLLFTSGTSGDPKVAVLRHENLVSYIFGTVEFMGAEPAEAQLVSVPPYHIAGIANLLSCIYGGRRILQLPGFEPAEWIRVAEQEQVTHAMVVPTMLSRVLAELARDPTRRLKALRHLSYGGGRMPVPVIEEAMRCLPDVDFVNAYGLTETSSTVAVLTPEDHRRALTASDETPRRRLGSVGRPLPTVEVSIRDEKGEPLPASQAGEIWVRGEQVAGEYVGLGSVCDKEGWFPTKDCGFLDEGGYLFVEGRLDDVIVRGGENISPGEIEDVLVAHPAVGEAAVFGVPDDEWGEIVVAAVVPAPDGETDPAVLTEWIRAQLRSSKVPSRIEIVEALPYSDTGKLLRRQLRSEFGGPSPSR